MYRCVHIYKFKNNLICVECNIIIHIMIRNYYYDDAYAWHLF